MKKTLYIYQLVLATFLMLLTTVVPHHHHEDEICIEVEHPDDKPEHDSACVKHMLTIQADASASRQAKEVHRYVPPYVFFRPMSWKAQSLALADRAYPDLPAFYHAPQNRGCHGLRAPPFFC